MKATNHFTTPAVIAILIHLLIAPYTMAVATECSAATYGSWVCGTDGNSYVCGRELVNNEWVFAWSFTDCQGTGCTMVDWRGDDTLNVAVCNSQIVSDKPVWGSSCTPGDMYVVDCICGEKNTILFTCSTAGVWVGGGRDGVCPTEVYLKYGFAIAAILLIYLIFIRKPPQERLLKQKRKP